MKLIKSFKYAFRGFKYCIINERNMRIHTVAALYVLFFSHFFSVTKEQLILILLAISGVITSEMINTAIESLSDFCANEYSPFVRLTKDIAAGAVVCSALFSLVIGIIIFFDINKILIITDYYIKNLDKLFLLMLSVILSVVYIVLGPVRIKNFFINLWRSKFGFDK